MNIMIFITSLTSIIFEISDQFSMIFVIYYNCDLLYLWSMILVIYDLCYLWPL